MRLLIIFLSLFVSFTHVSFGASELSKIKAEIKQTEQQNKQLAEKVQSSEREISKTKKDTTIAKQLLRSATSVGANINEAIYGNSKADFISKLHISLKETGESIYWLTLLKRTKLIDYDFEDLLSLAEKIKRMLIASLNTAKENNK